MKGSPRTTTSPKKGSTPISPTFSVTAAEKPVRTHQKSPSLNSVPSSSSTAGSVPKAPSPTPTASSQPSIFGDDTSTVYDPKKTLDLWPVRIPRFDWQTPLASNIANNSKSLLAAAIQIALVETTAISKNRLYLRVGDHSDLNRGVTMLFSEMQEEKAQQVMAHHAAYKSFWYKSGTMKTSSIRDFEIAKEADRPLVQTLMSYVPRIVVRRFVTEPHKPLRAPETETYYACVLFADISGFTPLMAQMATLGAEGVERVTSHLNDYFSHMINLISDHGGDVVKFAGDALIVIWPTAAQSGLYSMALLGCQCALALQRKMGHYVVGNTELRIHIGVGAGKVAGIHVGGVKGRHEFFVAGHPMEQVGSCEAQAEPGEIFVSPECQSIIEHHFVGEQEGHNFKLNNIESPMSLPHTKQFPLLDVLKTRLRSYVPAAVLSNLDTHDFLAELRTVSVLFVKLDYTYVNEEESPMAIQVYVSGMQSVIDRYEGTVRQFIVDDKGSVLIAAFGVPPLAHEDDPTRAVDCALDIARVLKSLKVSASIGITTGKTFCGAVGYELRREYAMVGDVVNLSARLMVAAMDKGGILCDRPTYMATRNFIKYTTLDAIKVKGKDKPIEIFRPEKSSSNNTTLPLTQRQLTYKESASGMSPPSAESGRDSSSNEPSPNAVQIIGQSKVIALFEYKLDQLAQNSEAPGHVLVLEGDPGIGKSKLVEKLVEMTNGNRDIFLGTLECGGTQQLFGPWAFVFDSLLDLQNGDVDSEQQLHEQVIEDVKNIGKHYPPPDLIPSWESIAPLLNVILPLLDLEPTEVTRNLTEQATTEVLQILLLRLLQTYVLPGSIIILEDAQEFDSASWTLALAASQQLKGVLITMCTRPPRPPIPFEYKQMMHCEHSTHVSLKPLSAQESVQLAELFLNVTTPVPPQLATVVKEKGQGNPFIIEQIVSTLLSSGDIEVIGGDVFLKVGAKLNVPTTVDALITSKIDRLSATQKNILKIASVIGKMFDYGLVKHLLPALTKQELLEGLFELQRAGLIVREENAATLAESDDSNTVPAGGSNGGSSGTSLDLRKSRRGRVGSNALPRRTSISVSASRRGTATESEDGNQASSAPADQSIKKSNAINPDGKAKGSEKIPLKSSNPPSSSRVSASPNTARQDSPKPFGGDRGSNSSKDSPSSPREAPGSARSDKAKEKEPLDDKDLSPRSRRRLKIAANKATSPTDSGPSSPTSPESARLAKSGASASSTSPDQSPSPRQTRPMASPRRLDSMETPRRTLKRGLSMRGTSRSLTLRKMSLGSDGTTPRGDSQSDDLAHVGEASEWSFRNGTIHEVVYSMMLFSQRRHVHSEIAKWYTTTYHESLSHHAAILGYHLKMSEENPAESAKWFAIAGQRALRNYSNQEAVSYFLEAIQLQKKLKNAPKPTKDKEKERETVSQNGKRANDKSKGKDTKKASSGPTVQLPQSPKRAAADMEDEFSLLTTHRRLGQAYFNLGDFNHARLHLARSLKIVKVDVATPLSSKSILPMHVSTKELQGVFELDAFTQREVILALLTMAKVGHYACSLDMIEYCNHAALAIAKKSNFWSELAEAYAQCIVTAGMCDQHTLVSHYTQEATKLAQDHLALMSIVNLNSGLYYLSRCAWQLAKRFFQSSLDASHVMGDRRRYEDILIHLSQISLIRGKHKQAATKIATALDSARLRGDVQCQILALIVQIYAHIHLRNFVKANSKLDQVRIMLSRDHTTESSAAVHVGAVPLVSQQAPPAPSTPIVPRTSISGAGNAIDSPVQAPLSPHSSPGSAALSSEVSSRSGDLSSEFNYHALLASLCLARGDVVACFESIDLAESILRDKHVRPSAFWTYPGYTGVPELYLRLLTHPKEWKKIRMSRSKLIKRFNKALQQLGAFSKIFLFAAPRYHLLQGLAWIVTGAEPHEKVMHEFKRGHDLAKQYKMPGEEQLIQSHIDAETTPNKADSIPTDSLLVSRAGLKMSSESLELISPHSEPTENDKEKEKRRSSARKSKRKRAKKEGTARSSSSAANASDDTCPTADIDPSQSPRSNTFSLGDIDDTNDTISTPQTPLSPSILQQQDDLQTSSGASS